MTTQIILKPVIRTDRRSHVGDAKLLFLQGGLCFYCDKWMCESLGGGKFHKDAITKDHFFPKSHGFDLCGNKVFACGECNSRKGNEYPSNRDIIKFVKLYFTRMQGQSVPHGELKRLVVRIRNNKPRFRLTITPELIQQHCR